MPRHRMRFYLSAFLLVLLTFPCHAQQARQYSFRHFSVMNGLASNSVTAVQQDGDGFIWMATANGLQRYDGYGFLTFRHDPANPASIPSTHIAALHIDGGKNLWLIGQNGRVGIFDTRRFLFTEVPVEKREPSNLGVGLMELPLGGLLFKSNGYLYQYRPEQKRFVPAQHLFPLPAGWRFTSIHWDGHRQRYWISCDSGLVQFNPVNKHLNYRGHNPDRDPVIEALQDRRRISSAITDGRGNLVYTTWPPRTGIPHIIRYHQKSGKAETHTLINVLRTYHEVYGFLLQKNGRFWVYGLPFLLEWRDEEPQPFQPLSGENIDEAKIKFDLAHHAFEDRENNIWLATDNGIYYFNPDRQIFSTYRMIRPGEKESFDRAVTCVQQIGKGRILAGTWGSAGLYCFDESFRPLPLPPSFPAQSRRYDVWDMGVNKKDGKLWITRQAGELSIYDPKEETFRELKPEIFGGSTIRQIDDDTAGNMWMGTQNGRLVKWDRQKAGGDPAKGYELITETGMILKVHYDYQGYIWVGTLDRGLLKIDSRTGRLLAQFHSKGPAGQTLYSNRVLDMTYYDDSTLIVAAGCLNIINTKTGQVRFINENDGLPFIGVQSVEKDEGGILWVGMTNGVCRVNMQNKAISYYDRRDGIVYDKFAAAGVQELDDGRLIFFTDHNLMVFDPETFGQQLLPPAPVLTTVRLGSRSLYLDSLERAGRLAVNYDNTAITIGFSALSFLQQAKLHYYYMLEGVDKDWVRSDKPFEAAYNFLPPGEYTFKVRSENADGLSSAKVTSLLVVVRPPFWNTWWFYGLVALLMITILYVIDRERITRQSSIRNMRREIAGKLHTEISNTLNNINVLSEIAKIKADKNVEQSKEYIGQISSKSRYMIEVMDDMLWSIDPQNDSMRKTILRIKELTEGIRSAYDIDIDLIVDHRVQGLELDMKYRHELFFFFKESVIFLIEHADCRQVFVNFNQARSRLLVEIIGECQSMEPDFVERYKKNVTRRIPALASHLDVVTDANSFSAVVHVNV
jgi:ligand-binding sensor domain-containing protein